MATTITGATATAISGGLTQLYRVGWSSGALPPQPSHEVVAFVTPAAPAALGVHYPPESATHPAAIVAPSARSRVPTADSLRRPSASARAAAAEMQPGDHAPGVADERASPPIAPTTGQESASPGSRNTASLVVLPPPRFSRSAPLGAAGRDSVLRVVAAAVPRLARTRRLTQAERDSLYILDARRQLMWREQGRPVPILPIGGGGISLPLFSPGPSRGKRMRDSVVHHDNLLRLRRIAERGPTTKVEAASRGADSLAKPTKTLLP